MAFSLNARSVGLYGARELQLGAIYSHLAPLEVAQHSLVQHSPRYVIFAGVRYACPRKPPAAMHRFVDGEREIFEYESESPLVLIHFVVKTPRAFLVAPEHADSVLVRMLAGEIFASHKPAITAAEPRLVRLYSPHKPSNVTSVL